MKRLLFEYEGKGQLCRVKWKSHNIRVELYQEDCLDGSGPQYFHFRLYVDDILRASRKSEFTPHDLRINYLMVEDDKEVLLECHLSHHYERWPSAGLSERIVYLLGGLPTLFRPDSVFQYGVVLHIGNELVYNSAKWAKLEESVKGP